MRRLLLVLTALLLAAAAAVPAVADVTEDGRTPEISIQRLVSEPDGTTRMSLRVSGLEPGTEVSLDQLEIIENGEVVQDVELAATESEVESAVVPALVVALDTSGSTQGEPLDAAKDAATQLVQDVAEAGGLVGVVAFAETVETVADLSSSSAAAVAGIAGLQAGGGTALRDGVARAARILASHDGPADVVVFSDGEDTTSQTSLNAVGTLLVETEVRVTSVVLRSEGFLIEPLEALADVSGGSVIEVTDAADLATAFSAIAGDLTNRLDVVWKVEPVPDPPQQINVVATYEAGDVQVSDGEQVASQRLPEITAPVPVEGPVPWVDELAGSEGLIVAVVAAAVAMFLLFFLIFAGAGDRSHRQALESRLAVYRRDEAARDRDDRVTLSARAAKAFEVLPRPANLDSRIDGAIEKADWPMRAGEFLLLSLGTTMLGGLVGGILFGSTPLLVVGLLLGAAGPWVYLRIAISRRQAAFAEQLPTVLQVLAGALRAGHAFSTALDGAVDEVDEPAKAELRRASVESRLGRPIDRALEGVADRMESEDLQWVIGALEVQREVGGNLAEILSNVADTLRDRASLARHVRALTAEGRLSAVFISAMPFVMFGYLLLTNTEYVRPLFTDPVGQIMALSGLVLLVIGILVLRRLVEPKF